MREPLERTELRKGALNSMDSLHYLFRRFFRPIVALCVLLIACQADAKEILIETRVVEVSDKVSRQMLDWLPTHRPGADIANLATVVPQAEAQRLMSKLDQSGGARVISTTRTKATPGTQTTIGNGGMSIQVMPVTRRDMIGIAFNRPSSSEAGHFSIANGETILFGKRGTSHRDQLFFVKPMIPRDFVMQPAGAPPVGNLLRAVASSVELGVGTGGNFKHGLRRGDEKLRRDDKPLKERAIRNDEKLRRSTEEKSRVHEGPKFNHQPEIKHDEEAIDYHTKRKADFERRLRLNPGPHEKETLEHHIKVEEDLIRRYQASLERWRGM